MKSAPEAAPDPRRDPAVRGYVLLCAAALVLIVLVDMEHGLGLTTLLVGCTGLLGVAFRLRIAPALLLLVLAATHFVRQLSWGAFGGPGYDPRASFRASDVVLCGAVLAYVAGHYRLQGLVSHLLPLDPRRREQGPRREAGPAARRPARVAEQRRSTRVVSPWEMGVLVLSVPLWALAAQAVWLWLAVRWPVLGLAPWAVRLMLLTWLIGVGALLTSAVLGYEERRRMGPDEGALLLQDTLWRETRREQRRINRWLAWARLRRPRKETP